MSVAVSSLRKVTAPFTVPVTAPPPSAVTHAANSFNVKIVDIIEKRREKFYKKFTLYLKNYSPTYRCNFDLLKENLLKFIKI